MNVFCIHFDKITSLQVTDFLLLNNLMSSVLKVIFNSDGDFLKIMLIINFLNLGKCGIIFSRWLWYSSISYKYWYCQGTNYLLRQFQNTWWIFFDLKIVSLGSLKISPYTKVGCHRWALKRTEGYTWEGYERKILKFNFLESYDRLN